MICGSKHGDEVVFVRCWCKTIFVFVPVIVFES